MTPQSHQLALPADAPTSSRLADRPITDLNGLTRRGVFRHTLSHDSASASKDIPASSGQRLLLALESLGVSTDDGLTGLQAFDALVLGGSKMATLCLPATPLPSILFKSHRPEICSQREDTVVTYCFSGGFAAPYAACRRHERSRALRMSHSSINVPLQGSS
ncbi:HutD family protein [Rhizobium sp. ZPR3]|uniref:HutD family protein n=2 Tax=unclassified Rhizobium TaxID=2613769 RepID=A0AAU7SQV9_9HYPH